MIEGKNQPYFSATGLLVRGVIMKKISLVKKLPKAQPKQIYGYYLKRGLHNTEVAYLLFTEQNQVGFSEFPRVFLLILLRFIEGTA